jgi:hypothetical protein
MAEQEMIKCSVCGETAHTNMTNVNGREWYELPEGWKAADTFPPGDDGLQFACHGCCLAQARTASATPDAGAEQPREGEDPALRRDIAEGVDPDIVLFDGLDAAIIGTFTRCGQPPVIAYSYESCVECFMYQGMSREEAEEWMSYNVEGGWVGDRTPAVIHKIDRG